MKALFYEITNKIPRKSKAVPEENNPDSLDHYSRQHYEAIQQIQKEDEAENVHMRSTLQEGISPLIRGKGGDNVPLDVINDRRINLDHYLYSVKKKEKEKRKTWKF